MANSIFGMKRLTVTTGVTLSIVKIKLSIVSIAKIKLSNAHELTFRS